MVLDNLIEVVSGECGHWMRLVVLIPKLVPDRLQVLPWMPSFMEDDVIWYGVCAAG